jgi:hypothetical protein
MFNWYLEMVPTCSGLFNSFLEMVPTCSGLFNWFLEIVPTCFWIEILYLYLEMVPTCSGLFNYSIWKWCPPVLEPNFDLSLGEAKLVCHLDPPAPGEVVVRVELLLQLQGLVPATHILLIQSP